MAYTLVDNCLILGIDPRRYLQDTIDKLERGHALSRMSELTPASWAANQAREQRPEQTRARAVLPVGKSRLCALSPVVAIHANLPHARAGRNHPACKGFTPCPLMPALPSSISHRIHARIAVTIFRTLRELLKLGIKVSKRTIQKYMRGGRTKRGGQSWATFLANHADSAWACDFIQAYDILFRQVYAFFIVHLGSRKVVYTAASRNPTQAWTAQQLRNATMDGEAPKIPSGAKTQSRPLTPLLGSRS